MGRGETRFSQKGVCFFFYIDLRRSGIKRIRLSKVLAKNRSKTYPKYTVLGPFGDGGGRDLFVGKKLLKTVETD